MNASWVMSAASAGLCMRLIAMLYTYVCWLWTSADSASRSPACARLTSAALGSAIRHSRRATGPRDPGGYVLTWVRRIKGRLGCSRHRIARRIAMQQRSTGRRLIGHETILHARLTRRHCRGPCRTRGGTCMANEMRGPSAPPYPPGPPQPRRLTRSSRERMWAGVAGGMAEYFELDPAIVRLLWVAAAVVTGGLAVPVYILAWIILPRDDRSTVAGQPQWRDWSQEFHSETQRLAEEARRVADDMRGAGQPWRAPGP